MTDWITNLMESLGYWGIGLLMFLENLFPPIPSELIMPLAGFTVSQGKMQFFWAVLAGVVGTIVGALPWYYVGKWVGEERVKAWADRYGRWLSISSKDIDRANSWFERYNAKAVLLCRLVPGVRTLISLPAGLSGMPLLPFLVYSTIGTTLWVTLLTYAGYALGQRYYLVDEYIGPFSKIVLCILVAAFVIWVVRKNWKAER